MLLITKVPSNQQIPMLQYMYSYFLQLLEDPKTQKETIPEQAKKH